MTQLIFVSSRTLCRDYRLQLIDPTSTTAVKYPCVLYPFEAGLQLFSVFHHSGDAAHPTRPSRAQKDSAIAVNNAALGTLLAQLSHEDELGHFYAPTKKLGTLDARKGNFRSVPIYHSHVAIVVLEPLAGVVGFCSSCPATPPLASLI
ncbi:hypothetical protein B0H17DRAFT_1199127 [Mycena rosella]|uniref:Uncharacterized protein n=1 Tax=Mycena rosella TaxID=1033263 RepID=A0AAD7DMD4_MYCRO|nr:hypothetical protein B0H17DRAFT_1206362 [Mycena rosella]KAJ7694601.1 hypothetical protein B0H17DRAFT_1199127 [Mycena rosella]